MGLPHSEILGSQLVCSSPTLIAAYHVLRRLPVPRHPPCALTRLISRSSVSRCDSSTPHTPLVSCQRAELKGVGCRVLGVRQILTPETWDLTPDDRAWKVRARGLSTAGLTARAYSALQKGGDPAAGSP